MQMNQRGPLRQGLGGQGVGSASEQLLRKLVIPEKATDQTQNHSNDNVHGLGDELDWMDYGPLAPLLPQDYSRGEDSQQKSLADWMEPKNPHRESTSLYRQETPPLAQNDALILNWTTNYPWLDHSHGATLD